MPKALIDALGKNVRSINEHKWIAKCPVHGDKDFAMTIKESDSGRIIIFCHACGANGLDVYKKLDLPFSELFGPAYISDRKNQKREKPVVTQFDHFFKAIYESDLDRYLVPREHDFRIYQEVTNKIQELQRRMTK